MVAGQPVFEKLIFSDEKIAFFDAMLNRLNFFLVHAAPGSGCVPLRPAR